MFVQKKDILFIQFCSRKNIKSQFFIQLKQRICKLNLEREVKKNKNITNEVDAVEGGQHSHYPIKKIFIKQEALMTG